MITHMMLPGFIRTGFDHLLNAYYDPQGEAKIPSDSELSEIESNIEILDMTGIIMMGSGGLGLGATLVIPERKPFLRAAVAIASLATSTLGYELTASAAKLQKFYGKEMSHIQKNELEGGSKPKECFEKEIVEQTTEETILIHFIYKIYKLYAF